MFCNVRLYSKCSGENIKVELVLANYVPKTYLKRTTGLDTSNLVVKSSLASLKAEVAKIDIDKLKTLIADLSKLSNIVYKDVFQNLCMTN